MAVQGLKNGQVSTDDKCEKKVFKDDFKDFGLSTWRSRLPFCIDMGSLEESQVWRNFILFSLPTFGWLWMASSTVDVRLSKLQEMMKDREAWWTALRGVAKNWTQLMNTKGPLFYLLFLELTRHAPCQALCISSSLGLESSCLRYPLGSFLNSIRTLLRLHFSKEHILTML